MFGIVWTKKRCGLALMASVSLLVVFVGIASASSGGGEAVAKSWLNTDTWRVMNFVVLMGMLGFVLRKPVSEALSGRIASIREQLDSLEQEKAAAQKRLAEYEGKIALLEDEAAKIIDQYTTQGESAKARILQEASASAEKLEEQAKKNIEQEFKNAKKQLQAEIMEKALENAEELIKKSIEAEDQERLVDEYLEKVVA